MLEQNLFNLTERFNILMNVEEGDKERFKHMVAWTADMMDMSIKEKYFRHIHPNRGEIWTCNFGENVGSEINKTRPALVIQNNIGNLKAPTTIVIPITSREKRLETHVVIDEEDLVYVEKTISGYCASESIRVISKARLGRKIAQVSEDFLLKVEKSIKLSLGFSDQTDDLKLQEETVSQGA